MSQPDCPAPFPLSPPVETPELVNDDPTQEEMERAYVYGEFLSVEGGYVLLEDGRHARVESYHDADGEQTCSLQNAVFCMAFVNGIAATYPLTLRRTRH